MMPIIGPTGNYICPYCGKLLNEGRSRLTKDHIVPRHFWTSVFINSRVFNRIKKDNPGISSVNDDRNIMYVCASCNHIKDNKFIAPTWDINGPFKYWDINHLRLYSEYFYYWSDCFIGSLKVMINKYESTYLDSYISTCSNRSIIEIQNFKNEYTERFKNNDWYIGG